MTAPALAHPVAPAPRLAVLPWGSELTLRTARAFTQAVRERLESGTGRIALNLEDVKIVDVAGLATLLQASRRAAGRGIRLAILPSPVLLQGVLDAGLVENLPLSARAKGELAPVERMSEPRTEGGDVVAVTTAEFVLRQPRWDDLPYFEEWSHDAQLRTMVGSELLYRCRHLGPYHPEFAMSVLHHPTSLTLVVQSVGEQGLPLGFVRLFGIHLGQGFGFLEAALVSRQALRRGWGVAASRLLSFYAQDVLGIRRIEAKVYDYNRLSINALRRNGFTQEGVLRGAAVHHGASSDIVVFGILEDEIREQRKKDGVPYLGLW
jgi:RimJ/RimL family protein N-acetyltransferase/ABC-type transporter Mla MlaB component